MTTQPVDDQDEQPRTLQDVSDEIGQAISVLHCVSATLGEVELSGAQGHAVLVLLNTTDQLQSLFQELTEFVPLEEVQR